MESIVPNLVRSHIGESIRWTPQRQLANINPILINWLGSPQKARLGQGVLRTPLGQVFYPR